MYLLDVAPPPPPPQKRRAKGHRALEDCDRMHEQTDFRTFSANKAQKGRYSPKNAIEGERNGLFQKGPKRASTFGKGLVLSRHNIPEPTQIQLIMIWGEFPKLLCIEQGVCILAGLPSGRCHGIFVFSGWQS